MDERILLIEDEEKMARMVELELTHEGYVVDKAFDGISGLTKAEEEDFDLILLDIMLPGMNGFDVCKKIRETSNVPIIMATAKEEEVDKILGLEFGADDYITKPFSVRELTARVKANLRRTAMPVTAPEHDDHSKDLISSGDLSINVSKYEVTKSGDPVPLTVREFELLKFLATQQEQVFSREQLLERVWGYEYFGDIRTVDVTVRRLREKIEDDSAKPSYVMTRRGVGYYFKGE